MDACDVQTLKRVRAQDSMTIWSQLLDNAEHSVSPRNAFDSSPRLHSQETGSRPLLQHRAPHAHRR